MSGIEFNKILVSIIITIILFVIIGVIGNFLIKLDKNPDQETAYKIEIPETTINKSLNTSNNNDEIIETISLLLAGASLDKGEKIFKKCATCHNYQKGSKSKIGPNLWDLINRPIASINGFAYSKALVDKKGKWTFEELNKFLYKPKEYIKGTKMNFAGLKNVEDRANLIFWLQQHSDNPVPLPE